MTYDAVGNTLSQQSAAPATPTIVGQPVPLLAAAPGLIAGFSVTIASPSPVTYQWSFNGVLIPGATGDSLLLTTVTAATEGSYTVRVTNSTGSVTSQPSTLAFDSNDNGLGDAWELQYFGNLTQKTNGDFDGDQLTNLEELTNGTNPAIRDAYYWTATSGDFGNPANWNWKRVPRAGDQAVINSGSFNLPSAATRLPFTVTVNVPFTASTSADTTLNGAWIFNAQVTMTTGRTFKVIGGDVILNGPAILNGANLASLGSNTKLTINGLTTYTQPDNTNVNWQVGDYYADNVGCELNFPNLTIINGGATTQAYNDYFLDLISYRLATLNLPALTTITAKAETATNGADSGVRLFAQNRGLISAPNLTAFNDLSAVGHSLLNATTSGRLFLPKLTAPLGVQLDLNALSTPEQFTSLVGTYSIHLNQGVVSMAISNLSGVTSILSDGDGTKLTFPFVTAYTQPDNTNVTWQAGDFYSDDPGCELNFPNLTTINGGATTQAYNDYFLDLISYRLATLNLPALTTITAKAETATNGADSGVRLFAQNRGLISAPNLTAFNDLSAVGHSLLNATTSGRLFLPKLTAPLGVQLDLNALSTPEQFTSLVGTYSIHLNQGVVSMAISNLSGVTSILSDGDGTKLTFPFVTVYTQPDNTNVTWQAGDFYSDDPGCELNFPNLTTINGGATTQAYNDYFLDLISYRLATLNLPALTTITAKAETATNGADNGVRLYAQNRGIFNAARLVQFFDPNIPFSSRIEVSNDSRYAFTSLRIAGLTGVTLSGVTLPTGPVLLNPPIITSSAVVSAYTGNSFSYQIIATNTPFGFGLSAVPAGLTFNPDTGLLTGEPAGFGAVALTMSAFNPDGTGTSPLTLTLTAPPSVPAPSEMYAWWTGNVDGRDAFGGQQGTLQGGVTIQPGRVGNAFTFTATGQGVTLPQSPALDLSRRAAWTVEAWINPTSFTGSTYPTIYAQGNFAVSLGLNQSTGKLESWINDSNRLTTTQAVALNRWTHVAMSYNGTNRVFYINGVNVGSGTAPAISDVNVASSIGNVTGSPSNSQFFGKIDELAVYGRALTGAEIAAIHASGITGKSLPASVAPAIVTQPVATTVREGNPSALNVFAVGPGPLTYQWFKGGVLIPEQTSATFTLSETLATNGGEYSVRVSTPSGSTLSQTVLLSINPSQLLVNNVALTGQSQATSGGMQYFRIAVPSGQDELVVKLEGGTGGADLYLSRGIEPTLSIYQYRSIAGGNNETIQVLNPQEGTWQIMVRAFSPYAGVSVSASYRVLPPPPVIVTQPQSLTVNEGQSASFSVSATGAGPLSYQWYKGASLLAGQTAATLQLPNVQLSSEGQYSVIITNDGVSTPSVAAQLTVVPPIPVSLANGVAVTELDSIVEGNRQYFKINVPSGQLRLVIRIVGGLGDADLYVRHGTAPSLDIYDFRPYLGGNDETVVVDNPAEGDWHIMLHAFDVYSGVSLEAAYTSASTFNSWRTSQFTTAELADLAISGPLSDADKDGLSNLLEYALGLNPKIAESAGQPQVGTSEGNLTLRYAKARSDITYTVLTSTDLRSPALWTTTGVTQGTPDSNGNVTASAPLTAPHRFLRLQVTLLP